MSDRGNWQFRERPCSAAPRLEVACASEAYTRDFVAQPCVPITAHSDEFCHVSRKQVCQDLRDRKLSPVGFSCCLEPDGTFVRPEANQCEGITRVQLTERAIALASKRLQLLLDPVRNLPERFEFRKWTLRVTHGLDSVKLHRSTHRKIVPDIGEGILTERRDVHGSRC